MKNLKIIVLMSVLFFVFAEAYSADPVTWSKIYGGSSTDYFEDICPTSDGGYIATGWTNSYGRGKDVWVVKLDSIGNILWQKAYGTSGSEEARTPHSIQQAPDGGYIVAANNGDFWILKLDSTGELEWQKKYGGAKSDFAWAVQNTDDGGYVVAGTTFSYNASNGSVFDADVWVLRLDTSGNVVWEKSYGGAGSYQFDMAFAIKQTFDGGFIVSAYTYAWSTTPYFSAWVLKLYADGEIEWQKAYGGGGDREGDFFNFVTQTSDGNYILTGNTMSWSPGPYNLTDSTNVWAMKLSLTGNVIWSKAYGGVDTKANGGSCIEEIADGNYIISGLVRSFGNSVSEELYDLWVLKIDPDGDIIWEKAYGGSKEDGQCRNGSSIRVTPDGGFILSGDTASFSASGTTDAWALKLDADGDIPGADMLITDTNATVTNIMDLVTVVSNAVPLDTHSIVTDTNVVPTQTTAVPVSLFINDATGDIQIYKCKVKAGKKDKGDKIKISGWLDATIDDFNAADSVIVTIEAGDLTGPEAITYEYAIDEDSFKKGKFKSPKVKPLGKTDSVTKLQINPIKGKINFSGKKLDLTGLGCPITISIQIGSYYADEELGEEIVNGPKKQCPPELIIGL